MGDIVRGWRSWWWLASLATVAVAQGVVTTTPGSVILSERGALTRTDDAYRGGQYFDRFEIELTEGQPITIELHSSDFDVQLGVVGPDFERLLDVDDSPGLGFDVRATFVPPQSGLYSIMVSSSERATLGAYELVVSTAAASATATPPAALLPLSVRGILVAGDRRLDGGEFVDLWYVELPARRPISVDLSSADFDVYLVVLSADESVVLDVDETPGRGSNVSTSFTASVAGPHLFAVTSARAAETGAYALEVRLAPDAAAPCGPAEGGGPTVEDAPMEGVSGIVGPLGIGAFTRRQLTGIPAQVAYHTYVLTVPEGLAQLTLEVQADVDLDLFVKHGTEIVDLGDGGDWEARDVELATTATVTIVLPRPGRYFVDVVWFGGQGIATYLISAR
jgi:hypothetical protein